MEATTPTRNLTIYEELSDALDQIGLAEMLATIADITFDKSERARETWQRAFGDDSAHALSERWQNVGRKIDALAKSKAVRESLL